MDAVDDYIHWHNERRMKMSLGGMSPLQYRRSLGLTA
ncbi:MAG: IS3 family transposase [Eggerthellaceae bacterium]